MAVLLFTWSVPKPRQGAFSPEYTRGPLRHRWLHITARARGSAPFDDPDKTLHPDEIAKTYLAIAQQDRSAWTWEIELRPSVEVF